MLERALNEELKSITKDELAERLKEEDLDMFRFLVDHEHFDSLAFSKEDLTDIIPPNFYLLLEYLLDGRERDLQLLSYLLERSLNEDLKTIVKEDLAKILEKGSLETLYFFYRCGYLEYISKERLSAIITPKFEKLMDDVFRDRVRLSSDSAILGYLLKRYLNTMFKNKITKIFESGVSRDIEYLTKHGFLNYLSKEELSVIKIKKDDSPFEFNIIMKELIRRRYYQFKEFLRTNSMLIEAREYVNFDIVLNELNKLETSLNLEELLVILKKEISMMLKEDSSTEFFNFLYSSEGGYFNLLSKEEKIAIFTQDNLRKIPLKGKDFFCNISLEYVSLSYLNFPSLLRAFAIYFYGLASRGAI